MANEKKTDILIARLLREAGIDAEPNGRIVPELAHSHDDETTQGRERPTGDDSDKYINK